MSPTEFDLRAALHDGEGDEPNVDQLILHGRARVAQRRVRVLSTAAAVAVVAGLGTGIAVLANGNGNAGNSTSNAEAGVGTAATRPGTAFGAASSAGAPQAAAPAASAAISDRGLAASLAVRCPASLPRYAVPGGGGTGQFGGDGPLFSKAVHAVVVCGYGTTNDTASGSTARPARLELRDVAATRLAASLSAASTTPLAGARCPNSASTYNFAIIGLTSDGARAGTVTAELTTPGCNGQVTNGTAVRYGWSPPAEVRDRLLALSRRTR